MEITKRQKLPNLRYEVDMLVVGAGVAGIRATITAHGTGAKAVLISALLVTSGDLTFYPLSFPRGRLYAEEKAED